MTTFETAKKLQESGFPQPAPAYGQVWYAMNGNPFLVCNVENGQAGIVGPSGQTWIGRYLNDGDMVYAPTATDILKELGSRYVLQNVNEDMFICKEGMPRLGQLGCKVNAAEAAAIEYLKKKKKS